MPPYVTSDVKGRVLCKTHSLALPVKFVIYQLLIFSESEIGIWDLCKPLAPLFVPLVMSHGAQYYPQVSEENASIHLSIIYDCFLCTWGPSAAGAHHSCLGVKAGLHPGQLDCFSQGHTEKNNHVSFYRLPQTTLDMHGSCAMREEAWQLGEKAHAHK